jgi:hypothetical protein
MRLATRLLFGCCCVAATFAVFIGFTLTQLRVVESSTGHEPVTRGLFGWLEFNCHPENTYMQGYEGYMYGLHWPRLFAEIALSAVIGIGFTASLWALSGRLIVRRKAK